MGEEQKTIEFSSIIVIIIILILISFLGIKAVLKNNEEKDESKSNEITTSEKFIANSYSMTKLIKDYFYTQGFIDKENLDFWTIDSINYNGDLDELKYYQVNGSYSCLDLTSNCLYIPQVGDKIGLKYNYTFYVVIEEKNNQVNIKRLETTLPIELANIKEELSTNYEKINQVTSTLKKYYEENNLIEQDNLLNLNFNNAEYVKTTTDGEIYYITGSYTCRDNTSNCFYVAQVDEPLQNEYNFQLYVLINDNKITNIDTIQAEESLESIFAAPSTKDKIINIVKDYNIQNNFVNSENLNIWNINKVTLIGYYNNSLNEKIYKLEGYYKCEDNSSDCLYLEQVEEQNSNNTYPYQIYAYITYDNNNLTLKRLSGTINNSDLIEINKIVR